MTNTDNDGQGRSVGSESRRSFVENGALPTITAGLAASGTAAAQEDEEDDEGPLLTDRGIRVALFDNDFRGGARFLITSGIIDYTPDVPQDVGGEFVPFNTHMATYLNTADRFTLFVSQDENLGANYAEGSGWFADGDDDGDGFNEPALYELANEYGFYGQTDRLITAYAYPLEPDAEAAVYEDEGFDSEADVKNALF